jgi:hypothetical protein
VRQSLDLDNKSTGTDDACENFLESVWLPSFGKGEFR